MAATPLWHAGEVQRATGGRAPPGRAAPDWTASGVSIDSRSLEDGDLFVALKGPNFDGHDYVTVARAAGAAAAVVHRLPEGLTADAPLVLVEDTDIALEALGRAARERTDARICCITGSVGKTGTKEALATALAAVGSTAASRGNLNNRWGVPLSLARMPRRVAFGVFELGMNNPGELTPLACLSRPHVAIITTVTDAHLEFFASVEAIADAKAEIFAGMGADGVAILHRESPFYNRLAAAAAACGVGRIVGFGADPAAEARLVEHRPGADGDHVWANLFGREIDYRLGLAGRHWAINSLAALAAVDAMGGDTARAAGALAKLRPLKGRGERHRIALENGSFELIDESYNASPAAMRAAFAVLAGRESSGRRIAILGDMLELGAEAEALHAALAPDLEQAGIDLAFTAGPIMGALHAALPAAMRGGHAADADALTPVVLASLRAGDVVLVKGSFGSRMAPVVDAVLAVGRRAPRRAANGH